MAEPEPNRIAVHEDLPLFREAVSYTSARTGLAARLIEKDYFCTVLLAYLARATKGRLIFKGATALAKIHAAFYRLSEDLDFTIPLPINATRRRRSDSARLVKAAVSYVAAALPDFVVYEPMRGANNSTQYNAAVRYRSPTTAQDETIRIEVGLREPLLTPVVEGRARTMLLNPVTDQPLVGELTVPCIGRTEALAEEFRAALTRREVAIRDFYDLHYAARHLGMNPDEPDLGDLVRRKLATPGNLPVNINPQRLSELRKQLETRLRPVLRPEDFESFDLDHAIRIVATMAETVR